MNRTSFTDKLAFMAGLTLIATRPLAGCVRQSGVAVQPVTVDPQALSPRDVPQIPVTEAINVVQDVAVVAVIPVEDAGCGAPVTCDGGLAGLSCNQVGAYCRDGVQSFPLICRMGGDNCTRWWPSAVRGPAPPPELLG